ncbi:hypothetical protein LPB138_00050 [Urechidicola croceus]|uniref:DinB-like domain-containing protein n=2 Tax=Urechidicola croceus TaxID=1850246 RepID=A0A1D8PBJ9_9FLAO|nr:hypothetical protein LPB138_00050 [Urechidicola croceus]
MAQSSNEPQELPYYEVPDYDKVEYTAGTVTARLIDGLGFRYRWATENLREEDLNYQVTDSSRTIIQTIDHLLGLSRVIVNSTLKVPTDFTQKQPKLTYEEKRIETLNNFKNASKILMTSSVIEDYKIQFIFTGGESQYPFWNNINGPIADAIWHSGQIATLRRASGNPMSKKVRFLEGKIED